MLSLTFSGTCIALIVRGKTSARHHPSPMAQHTDCILPDGAPIGFYGQEKDQLTGQWPATNPSTVIGMNMPGVVYDYESIKKTRPWYVDVGIAKQQQIYSTILKLHVTTDRATRFKNSWLGMQRAPGPFNFVGYNCATHAALAFVEAGILTDEIPGLDTPDHLYEQLVKAMPGNFRSFTGFLGFSPKSGGGFLVHLEPKEKAADRYPDW